MPRLSFGSCGSRKPLWLTRMLTLLAGLAVALPLCVTPMYIFGAEKQITVRFLDPKSGKPIRKMWVNVTQYSGNPPKGPIPAEYIVASSSARTDKHGEVVAVLHEPLATYIGIHSFDLAYSDFLIPIAEVLKTGVVLDCSPGKEAPQGYWVDGQGRPVLKSGAPPARGTNKASATIRPGPEPGVIVLVETRLTIWDKMRQELPR